MKTPVYAQGAAGLARITVTGAALATSGASLFMLILLVVAGGGVSKVGMIVCLSSLIVWSVAVSLYVRRCYHLALMIALLLDPAWLATQGGNSKLPPPGHDG